MSAACEKCQGTGKISYRMLGAVEPTDLGNGVSVQDMGGSGTRACECVRDLPAIDGDATWWELESIHQQVVIVPIGNDAIEINADCEVPRNEHGRRVHRVGQNVYYPSLIVMEAPGRSTLHSDTAREIAAALIAAADAVDARDQPAFASLGTRPDPGKQASGE